MLSHRNEAIPNRDAGGGILQPPNSYLNSFSSPYWIYLDPLEGGIVTPRTHHASVKGGPCNLTRFTAAGTADFMSALTKFSSNSGAADVISMFIIQTLWQVVNIT